MTRTAHDEQMDRETIARLRAVIEEQDTIIGIARRKSANAGLKVLRCTHGKRRERIATAALSGLLAYPRSGSNPGSFAAHAVACADALIAELDKEPSR